MPRSEELFHGFLYVLCDFITDFFLSILHNKATKTKEDSTMKFHLDERLIEHMKKSNHKNILITPMMCHT